MPRLGLHAREHARGSRSPRGEVPPDDPGGRVMPQVPKQIVWAHHPGGSRRRGRNLSTRWHAALLGREMTPIGIAVIPPALLERIGPRKAKRGVPAEPEFGPCNVCGARLQ